MVTVEDRDEATGHFLPGRPKTGGRGKGSGNKKKSAIELLWHEAISYQDVLDIIKKMVAQAKAGDKDARKEVFNRLYGKAAIALDLNVSHGPKIVRAPFAGPSGVIDVTEESRPFVEAGGDWRLGEDYAHAEELAAQVNRELQAPVHDSMDTNRG